MEESDSVKERRRLANELASKQGMIHNFIRNYLESILNVNLSTKSEAQQRSFMRSAAELMHLIHLHHSMEETYWFPTVSSICKINLDHFVSDHREFDELWNTIDEKLDALRGNFIESATSRVQRMKEVQELFRKMQQDMLPHLQLEEDTINSDLLFQHFPIQKMRDILHM